MATPVVVVASGGIPVTEATSGTPMTPAVVGQGPDVTIVAAGGIPVTFVGVDGVLWPGGVEPE